MSLTHLFIICLAGRWSHNCRIEVNSHCFPEENKTKKKFVVKNSIPFGRSEQKGGLGWGGMGWADVSQPSVSCWCVSPQQLRATLTMALAASWTLLALFVTFCTPGWTGKCKRKARLCPLCAVSVRPLEQVHGCAAAMLLKPAELLVLFCSIGWK